MVNLIQDFINFFKGMIVGGKNKEIAIIDIEGND